MTAPTPTQALASASDAVVIRNAIADVISDVLMDGGWRGSPRQFADQIMAAPHVSAALAPVGVPESVREAYEHAELSKAQAADAPEHPGLRTAQAISEDAFRRSAASWARTLLSTPSGRADTPLGSGGTDRDPVRFAHLSLDGRPPMPPGYTAELVSPLVSKAAPLVSGEDDTHRCGICDEALIAGQLVLTDVELGTVHAACCGPERESYVKDIDTGEPLGPNDPIPAGRPYEPFAPLVSGGAVDEAFRAKITTDMDELGLVPDPRALAAAYAIWSYAKPDGKVIYHGPTEGECYGYAWRALEAGGLAAAPAAPEPTAGGGREIVGPVAWVIPGTDTADANGAIDARCIREGEFTRPLYALDDSTETASDGRDRATLRITRGQEGLFYVTSPEVRGLFVAGHSLADVLASTPRELTSLAGIGARLPLALSAPTEAETAGGDGRGQKTIPCGGCGATRDDQRCVGCLHDFGDEASAWVHQRESTSADAGAEGGQA